jgi:dinuclear metal center YbgI/SA1388 family protein
MRDARVIGDTIDSGAMTARVGDVIDVLHLAYPPELAQSWDAVGLVCGDPAEPVERVLVAVDATAGTVDEAIDGGAGLLVVHHPLLLRGVHGVGADTPKGALVHRLIRAGVALFTAHTNADAASPGVSDALASALGLSVLGPLEPRPPAEHAVPTGHAVRGSSAEPDPSGVLPGVCGLGRIAELPAPEPFAEFIQRAARRLPVTAWGVRGAGDPDRPVRTVAVCGGAGDSLLGEAARAGVDAYLTADLRHHPADEHLRAGRDVPALVDVAHWASEQPWCAQAAEVMITALGGTVEITVSHRRTDPWTIAGRITA